MLILFFCLSGRVYSLFFDGKNTNDPVAKSYVKDRGEDTHLISSHGKPSNILKWIKTGSWMMRRLIIVLTAIIVFAMQAHAGVLLEASGVSSKGVDITFKAELSIVGDVLTIVLTNDSPVYTLNPDETLGSFYFDIVNDLGERPTLTYVSAIGDVYLVSKTAPDSLVEADADIMAVVPGDNSWQFATMDEMLIPYLGFGIGTVGNSNLSPNNFNGNIVNGSDYSIYKGEITTQNLNGKLLVKETATFTFTGVTGFTEDDIAEEFAFGLGTAPDSLLTPEPATLVLLGIGCLLLRKRK